MKKMYPLIDGCLKYLFENLDSHIANGKEVIVKDLFGCLTMDVIAKCAFGTDTNAHKDKNNPFVVNGKRFFEIEILPILIKSLIPNFLLRIIGLEGLTKSGFSESADFFFKVSCHIIKYRREKTFCNCLWIAKMQIKLMK